MERMKSTYNFPTYDEIMQIPIGSKVQVHLRERTGERCIVSGNIHTPKSGVRMLGPFTLAGEQLDRSSVYDKNVAYRPYVPASVVALTILSSPVVSA